MHDNHLNISEKQYNGISQALFGGLSWTKGKSHHRHQRPRQVITVIIIFIIERIGL